MKRFALMLAALAVLTPAVAHAAGASSFGPDHNLPINHEEVVPVRIPAGQQATLRFSFDADWVHMVIVYNGAWESIAERGNFGRNTNELVIPAAPQDRVVYVTDWHKESGPAPALPWLQTCHMKIDNPTGNVHVAFEDGKDGDYNDAQVFVTLKPAVKRITTQVETQTTTTTTTWTAMQRRMAPPLRR